MSHRRMGAHFLCAFVVLLLTLASGRAHAQIGGGGCIDCPGDDSPPVVSISPASGTFSASALAVTINWNEDDLLGANTRNIRLNGTNITSSFSYSSFAGGSAATSSGTITLASGTNTLAATICNASGMCTTESATFTYAPDVTSPSISFSPASGFSTTATSVGTSISWGDNQSLNGGSRTITLNGASVTGSFGYSGTATSATSSGTIVLVGGSNTMSAHVCDAANNCTTVSATYTRTVIPPTISFTPGTRSGASQPMTIDWTDDIGLNDGSRTLTLNGTAVGGFSYGPLDAPPTAKTSSGTLTLQPGNNVFAAHICDVDSACTTQNWSFSYDNLSPTVAFTGGGVTTNVASRAIGIDWCDNVSLNGGSRDIYLTQPGAPIIHDQYASPFGYTSTSAAGCGAAGHSGGTMSLYNGQNEIHARICDSASNCAEQTTMVTLDQAPPGVTLTPSSGGVYGTAARSVTVAWSDNLSLNSASRSLTLNGVSVTGSFGYTAAGGTSGSSTGTVTLAAGGNTLTAHICDAAGNCASQSATYTYDPTPPTVAFSPGSGSFTTTSRQITINWGDNLNLSSGSRTVTLNGASVTSSFGYSGTATSASSVGTITLAQGANTVTAHICDGVGNCTTQTASYTADSSPPTVAASPASGGSYAASTLPVSISWGDNLNLDSGSRSITLNGVSVLSSLGWSSGSATSATSAGTLSLSAGTNTLVARICDNVGNCTSQTATYVSDPVAPTVALSPGTGSFSTSGRSVTVTWGDNLGLDSASRTVTRNGTSVTTSLNYTGSATSASSTGNVTLATGANTVTAHICDNVGNCASQSATYTFVPVPPTIAFTPGNRSGALQPMTIDWTDDVGLDVASHTLTLNGAALGGFSLEPPLSSPTAKTSSGNLTLQPGSNVLVAHICDVDDACTTQNWSFSYDNQLPTIAFTDGGNANTNVGSRALDIDWCDNVSLSAGTRDIYLTQPNDPLTHHPIVDSYATATRTGCTAAAHSSGTITLLPGHNDVHARICDNADNCHEQTALIIFDETAPLASVSPVSGSTQGGRTLGVTITWTDNETLNSTVKAVTMNGTDVTSVVDFQPTEGTTAATSSGALALRSGLNTMVAHICDFATNCVTQTSNWPVPFSVSVTPPSAATVEPFATTIQTFLVQNTGTAPGTFSLVVTCDRVVVASCTAPASIELDSAETKPVAVTVHTRSGEAAATRVLLMAVGDTTDVAGTSGADSVALTVKSYRVALTPQSTRTTVVPGGTVSQSFMVTNIGTVQATYHFGVVCPAALQPCTTPSNTTLAANDSASVTLTYQAGAHGTRARLILGAGYAPDSSAFDSAYVDVTARDPSKAWVAVAEVNPGTAVERDLCVTAAAGTNAAFQCGDLRLVHALPTTRTMGTARTPTLIYNSAEASAGARLAAEITLGASDPQPDSVTACATFTTGQAPTCGVWVGAGFAASHAQRVTLFVDGSSLPRNPHDYASLHEYTLEVRGWFGTTGFRVLGSNSGEVIVVDRKDSPFGRGWTLAGMEQLFFLNDSLHGSRLLWLGGDGSARVYQPAGIDRWQAPSLDRIDVITKVDTLYTRELPNNLRVVFNSFGRHIQTVNRLSQTTYFNYDGVGRLLSIRVPLPKRGGGIVGTIPDSLHYTFDYATAGKVIITAPPAGIAPPRDTLSLDPGGLLLSVKDPDGKAIQFAYDTNVGRVGLALGRTDKLLNQQHFAYDAWSRTLSSSSIPVDTSSIITFFSAAEAAGINHGSSTSTSIPSDSAYTLVNGPRVDTTVTRFWVDRYGAPTIVRNALGARVTIERGDLRFPALVTRVINPNDYEMRAAYDSRGRLTASVSVKSYCIQSQSGCDKNDTTTYVWDATWDELLQIRLPEGETTTFDVDSVTGLRRWKQDARGSASRVTFAYYTDSSRTGLPESLTLPGRTSADLATATQRFDYDVLGNLRSIVSPTMIEHRMGSDAAGRPVADSVVASRTFADTTWQVTETIYDALGRVQQTIVHGPAQSGVGAMTQDRKFYYNASGDLDSLLTGPFASGVGGYLRRRWTHDALGRQRTEEAELDGHAGQWVADSTFYDAAGNAIRRLTRTGGEITYKYDALNRLVTRTTSSVAFAPESIGLASDDAVNDAAMQGSDAPQQSYPYYGSGGTIGGTYTIGSNMDTFVYDPVSGVLTDANNGFAKVHRTYYPNGQLRGDTLTIREWADSVFSHAYGMEMTYDRDGRRKTLQYPTLLSPGTSPAATQFGYDATGALASVTDLQEYTTTFGYNFRDEPTQRLLPTDTATPLDDEREYDDEGLLHWWHVGPQGSTDYSSRFEEHMYDARGRDTLEANAHTHQVLRNDYDGLGQLHRHLTYIPQQSGLEALRDQTLYTTDGLGNLLKTEGRDGSEAAWNTRTDDDENFRIYDSVGGRLILMHDGNTTGDTTSIAEEPFIIRYDAAGNEIFRGRFGFWALQDQDERRSYYAADNQLRAVDAREWLHDDRWSRTFEEYRYDAFGRRIAVRARRDCRRMLSTVDGSTSRVDCRVSTLRRTVWDGDAELGEIQIAGSDSANLELESGGVTHHTDNLYPFFGRVAYVYGLELDQPLAITRLNYQTELGGTPDVVSDMPAFTVYPLWDHHGLADAVSSPTASLCSNAAPGNRPASLCARFDLANNLWLPYERLTGPKGSWNGSLLEDKADAGGTLYRRNRYYDPGSGRFTQEDPIGLAGGINLYGFAGGDPVSYSDPFGLCPKYAGGDGATSGAADCSQEIVDAWAARHVQVNPKTNWDDVDPALRDAVARGSIDMNADFYVSAGQEGGHAARSFHALGLAVDISRVNGVKFVGMSDSQAILTGGAVADAITGNLARGRWAEVFSPASLNRYDKNVHFTPAQLQALQRKHRTHVHISVTPE